MIQSQNVKSRLISTLRIPRTLSFRIMGHKPVYLYNEKGPNWRNLVTDVFIIKSN